MFYNEITDKCIEVPDLNLNSEAFMNTCDTTNLL